MMHEFMHKYPFMGMTYPYKGICAWICASCERALTYFCFTLYNRDDAVQMAFHKDTLHAVKLGDLAGQEMSLFLDITWLGNTP